jgi:hypothetical protein
MKKNLFTTAAFILMLAANAQVYNNVFKIQSSETEQGMRITNDKAGNVITTGSFGGAADFDPSNNSESLAPGSLSEDIYIAKYDASLNFIWARKFSTGGSGTPYSLATDASNNIIIGGDKSSNNRDGFVSKYDANGNLTWSISIGGTNKDVVYGVQTDDAKFIYVTGYFSNTVDFDPGAGTYTLSSKGGRDIFLAKYDSTGKLRWAFNTGGPISTAYEEGGQDIAISGADIYLTGNFEGLADFDASAGTGTLQSNGSLDMFIAKYDTSGSFIWAKSMGSNNKHDFSYALDLDASDNIYITGGFEETVDFDPSAASFTLASLSVLAQDIFVAKYNSSGLFQWAFQVGGNTSVDDHAFDIDVTPSGDIYICGEVWGPADFDPSPATYNINPSNDQIFFARYTNTGALTWAFDIGSTSGNGSADNGYGVHCASTGSVYVTGDYSGTADFNPLAGTATLSSSGSDAFVGVYGNAAVVGVNEVEIYEDLVTVFPNPSKGIINVLYPGYTSSEWSVEITDLQGKLVSAAEHIRLKSCAIDIKNIPAGVYLCTVRTENELVSKKIVLQ